MRAFQSSLFLTLAVAGTVASYACSAFDSEADVSLDLSQRDGPYELYYDDGQLEEKGTYKAGMADGPYERYHENGQLWVKGTYKAGERDGAYEVYRENGQLEESGMYRAGQRVGSKMQLQRN